MNKKQRLNESGAKKKTIIMSVVLGLLIIVSGVQAVELVNLKTKLNDGLTVLESSSGGGQVSVGTGSSGGGLSNNLKNLPSMVGGC